MRKATLTVLCGLLVLVALSFLATDARAYDHGGGYGCYGFGLPYAMNYLLPQSHYSSGRIPTPPYFALHPPVYYDIPVARTYGYSPFAYPPYVRTPDAPRDRSKMIINPHVAPAKTTGATKDEQVAVIRQPRIIANPYVDRTDASVILASER